MTVPAHDEPTDLSHELLSALNRIFGVHPGYRPVHAKGLTLSGTFTPSADASSLTRAAHANRESTPVTVRFSDSAGIPTVADNDPEGASPRGMAVRFHLGEHEHTDIVAHSHNAFPVRTPEEFLELLHAIAALKGTPSDPGPIQAFLGSHPAAQTYLGLPSHIPTSFATDSYFGVTAFLFTNGAGDRRFGRYRLVPEGGAEYLSAEEAAAKSPDFLFDEVSERVSRGPVRFRLMVQLAESGDTVDDSTAVWPEERPQLELGTIALTARVADEDPTYRKIIFDPVPRLDGIEPSGDPLPMARSGVYLLSGRRRRSDAASTQATGGD